MTKDTNREQWVDEVLNSTGGMQRAMPPGDLFDKISRKLNEPKQIMTVRLPIKQWAAAAIILLTLNIGSVLHFASANKRSDTAVANPIAAQMIPDATYNY